MNKYQIRQENFLINMAILSKLSEKGIDSDLVYKLLDRPVETLYEKNNSKLLEVVTRCIENSKPLPKKVDKYVDEIESLLKKPLKSNEMAFNECIKYFKNTPNIKVFNSEIWRYFCQFKNLETKRNDEFFNSLLKMYIPVKSEYLAYFCKDIFGFMAKENIQHSSKIGIEERNDDLVIRVVDTKSMQKIIDYVKGKKYSPKVFLSPNPFSSKEDNISLAKDGHLSYNTELSKAVVAFVNDNSNNKISIENFNEYVKTLNKRTNDIDKEQIYQLLSMNLEGKNSLNEYTNFYNKCVNPNIQENTIKIEEKNNYYQKKYYDLVIDKRENLFYGFVHQNMMDNFRNMPDISVIFKKEMLNIKQYIQTGHYGNNQQMTKSIDNYFSPDNIKNIMLKDTNNLDEGIKNYVVSILKESHINFDESVLYANEKKEDLTSIISECYDIYVNKKGMSPYNTIYNLTLGLYKYYEEGYNLSFTRSNDCRARISTLTTKDIEEQTNINSSDMNYSNIESYIISITSKKKSK